MRRYSTQYTFLTGRSCPRRRSLLERIRFHILRGQGTVPVANTFLLRRNLTFNRFYQWYIQDFIFSSRFLWIFGLNWVDRAVLKITHCKDVGIVVGAAAQVDYGRRRHGGFWRLTSHDTRHDTTCLHRENLPVQWSPITYHWTVPLILDHSYLVGKLRSLKIADTKVSICQVPNEIWVVQN
jgi:hypothetical protein